MKNKTIKLTILFILGVVSLYFVVARNGSFSLEMPFTDYLTTGYAALVAIFWGIYKLVIKKGGRAILAALVFFSSIIGLSFLTEYSFSPTQYVAIIALFYYSSKILENIFKK